MHNLYAAFVMADNTRYEGKERLQLDLPILKT